MPLAVELRVDFIRTGTGCGLLLHFGQHTFLLVKDQGAELSLTEPQAAQVAADVAAHISSHLREIDLSKIPVAVNKAGRA